METLTITLLGLFSGIVGGITGLSVLYIFNRMNVEEDKPGRVPLAPMMRPTYSDVINRSDETIAEEEWVKNEK